MIAWRDLRGLRDPDRFDAWLTRLVVHVCISQATRERRRTANLRLLPVDGPAAPDELLSVADRDLLDRGFRRLPPEQRAILAMHHYLGYAPSEIAETLGIPAGHRPVAAPSRPSRHARRAGGGRARRHEGGPLGMTPDDTIERLLDAWFAEGPGEAPDRVLDGVADRIHGHRQRPAWRLDTRSARVRSLAKPLAVLAAVVVIAVAAFTLTRPTAEVAAPSPTPTPTASTAFTCEIDSTGCAGPLGAGEHSSSHLEIPMRYTVPDGWANSIDIPRSYKLATTSGIAAPIEILTNVAIADQAACGPVRLAGSGTSVQDLIDHVATHPGLDATTPVSATLDGYEGQSIDFSVRSDWTAMCPAIDTISPRVMLLTDTATPPGRQIGYAVDSRVRWIVLDVAGETVVVEIVGPPARAQFDAAIAADQPVIDSFDFTPGG